MARKSLIGLLAIASVIGRWLRAFRPLVSPDRSVVLASAEGALTRDAVTHGEMSGSQDLIVPFNKAPHGARVEG